MNHSELFAAIAPEIAAINETMRADLAGVASATLAEVLNHAVFNGGKRVRPVLAILAARLCLPSGSPLPADTYRLAITFEYLHAASLLHDDVIDHALQRRGNATANSLWGNTPVVLAGDYLHARAMLLAGTTADSCCLSIIGQATTAMVEAEFLQMQTAHNGSRSEKYYFTVLEGKTGALIAAACEAGALLARADDQQKAALRTYGKNLGLAFQLVDDLLDYLGDPLQTGKAVGNDLLEGKATLPLIRTLEIASPVDREFLDQVLAGDASHRSAHFEQVSGLIEQYGGFVYTRQMAQLLLQAAMDGLEEFPAADSKEVLIGLADYVLTRKK